MNKKTLMIFMAILLFIILCLFVVLMYNLKTPGEIATLDSANASSEFNSQNLAVTKTSSEEIKLSPNTIITFLKSYNGCGHIIKSIENIPPDMVNMSKIEFSNAYSDWEISKFTNSEVELTKTFNGNCGEHFLVKSNDNGYINIYNIRDNNSLDLKEETEIAIKYLSVADIEELNAGVILYGKENLNAYIENFE